MEPSEGAKRSCGTKSRGPSSTSDGKASSSWDWKIAEELPVILRRSTQVGHAMYENASRSYLMKFAESWAQQPAGSSPEARRLLQGIYNAAVGGQDVTPDFFPAPQPGVDADADRGARGAATRSEK